ncbi:MAG: NUDIX domain-containing protein [Actinobacteria bacterium]|jgi:8-oxo-dGTP pyrophosphatase MutT (NUDIX family)|nr:NUDIX domain-containing protein [Actinomycetota bacterium]
MTDAVEELRAHLDGHNPRDLRERTSLRRTLAMLDWLPRPLDETADPAHVTGSAIVLDDHGRVLLHRHKRLGIWLQPGGHVDPGETVAQGSIRETYEETGLDARHPGSGPAVAHVDVHQGPRGHVHLDVRYLLLADGAAAFAPHAGESPHVGWFDLDGVREVGDASLISAAEAALTRVV